MGEGEGRDRRSHDTMRPGVRPTTEAPQSHRAVRWVQEGLFSRDRRMLVLTCLPWCTESRVVEVEII